VAASRLTRRQVLVGGGLVGAAVIAGAAVVTRLDDDEPASGSAGTVPAATAIAAVGAAYLAQADAREADEAFLRAELPTLTAADAGGVVDQLPTLAEPVTADFEAERTASVDGWVLALSEARAAALVHLLSA
jgi:hypothetical protein